MADLREQMEEIKALLFSEKNKASAYPKLLHLQEISAVEPSSVQIFVNSSHDILASLVPDIFANDEEIAAQALKCLGFMIYHPTIVASIGDDDANVIIEALVKVILTTKIKSVCNLGIWCISIQEFRATLLDRHIHSLLRAIIHALDNPIGSLSTTFEAMQAVVKLTSSLAEQMRNMSSVWTSPIYRRLVSVDKRDRDMSERCLLKIMPVICPPLVTLSKALAVDMKKKLLSAMKELLDQGMKIQCLQAWGWFIRLLGPYAIKNKDTVNEMLKILEKTFSDTDSQVQIASLIAWEGLIDAFIQPRVQDSHISPTIGHEDQVLGTSEHHNSQTETEKQLKRFKLIMSPLIGIMSSKCDVSVHASCLSTWSYLLHKLNGSVSYDSVIKNIWEPMIEVVFRVGPNNKNIWFFDFCVDLLDALILGRNQGTPSKLHEMETSPLSLKKTTVIGPTSEKCPLRHYPINCSSWKLFQLDFFIKMIDILVNRESNSPVTAECGRLCDDAALRLFGSLLEAVQRALRSVSITYDEVMQSLNTVFRFLEKICRNTSYSSHACLKFLEVVTERLDPSILESPLYKVGLDSKFIKNFVCDAEIRSSTLPGICCMDSEDKVLPLVYLCTLYFCVVINSSAKESEYESLLQQMQGYVKFLLSSNFSEEVLRVFISLLYKSTTFTRLQIWVVLASCIKDCINSEKAQSMLKLETENIGYSLVLHLLAYPFASWYFSPINHDLQNVVEAWNSLFLSIYQASQSVHCSVKSFSEDLCALLNGCIDQITPTGGTGVELQLKEKNYSGEFVLLYGGVIICILEKMTLSISSKESHNVDCGGGESNISNCIELAARFMMLLWETKEIIVPPFVSIVQRFLAELVNFVGCLYQKIDILMLIESTSSPLLQWISDIHLLDEKANNQLQILWPEILKSLQQSYPPLNFDSSFLKLQSPLLEITLDHQNPAISEPTINFWNSTYGKQFKLEFPQNLLPVLDKLSRNGKINLFSRYKMPTTLKKCSKRVEIVGNPVNESDDLDSSAKRKRAYLTEHQKEVRRAQQGRAMDCSGRGPGIRTYTNVDFSQGNEESQDSQDIRDAESILEMLKKVR